MQGSMVRGIVINLCLVFSSSVLYAQENHLFNFINKVADGTQQMAKGIIHGTERALQQEPSRKNVKTTKMEEAKPEKVVKKKPKIQHTKLEKEKIKKQNTTLAQETTAPNNPSPTQAPANQGTPSDQNMNSGSTNPSQTTDASNPQNSMQTNTAPTTNMGTGTGTDAGTGTSGSNTNIPDVAEPGQSGSVSAPDANQLPEPPQTNDTTTAITGGEAY
jgi:hypothetical protein